MKITSYGAGHAGLNLFAGVDGRASGIGRTAEALKRTKWCKTCRVRCPAGEWGRVDEGCKLFFFFLIGMVVVNVVIISAFLLY